MGLKNGEDIRRHIRENVRSADFSFLMISKNYKASEICLNEMGAVWATVNGAGRGKTLLIIWGVLMATIKI